MKRTLYSALAGFALVALMTACGGSDDDNKNSGSISTNGTIGNTVSGNFDPNTNTFLNGCQGCQVTNQPCGQNSFLQNGVCVSHQTIGPQQLQGQFQNAYNVCGNQPSISSQFHTSYINNPNQLYSQCNGLMHGGYGSQYAIDLSSLFYYQQPQIYDYYQPQYSYWEECYYYGYCH